MMSQLQVSHSQVTWWGVLVAKQQARRKPKGLRNRDEQSQRCVCVCVSEGGRVKAGLQIRAASVVIIRCCRKSQRLPLRPVALSLHSPRLSLRRPLSVSLIQKHPVSRSLYSPSLSSSPSILLLRRYTRLLQSVTPNYRLSLKKLQM